MRGLLPLLLLPVLGGCATGYARDWFRARPNIINPQLIRYGLDVQQSRCVGEKLGTRLSRPQLGQFQVRAAALRPSAQVPLNLANLRSVAASMRDREITAELDAAVAACNVTAAPALAAAAPATAAAVPAGGQVTSGGIPVDMTPISPATAAAAPTATWLNLGAAESGQSIAIDATSILQDGATRTAWFRMTDPQNGGPSGNAYRLKVDCEAHTVQPLALRQNDPTGALVSMREYTPAEARPGPAESGTVLEIAYISLCT